MRLLALDGGLDETGWAVFDVRTLARPLVLQAASEHFLAAGTWYSPASLPMEARLLQMSHRVRCLVAQHGPVVTVALEHTPFGVTYRQRRNDGVSEARQARSLQLHALADGCLAGTVLAAVEPRPRLLLRAPVRGVLRQAPTLQAVLPGLGRTSEHARAAIALGLDLLSEWHPAFADPDHVTV